MNFFVQPVPQGLEVTPFERALERSGFLFRGGKKLGRIKVAQGIGGEIAETTVAPMDVLEAALGIIWRNNAQVLFHRVVPDPGNVRRLQASGDEGGFNIESKADMKVVSHLVRFGADQR